MTVPPAALVAVVSALLRLLNIPSPPIPSATSGSSALGRLLALSDAGTGASVFAVLELFPPVERLRANILMKLCLGSVPPPPLFSRGGGGGGGSIMVVREGGDEEDVFDGKVMAR